LSLAKPKAGAGLFSKPELASEYYKPLRTGGMCLTSIDDDNWDDDFASAISPSALHLPQLKGQDNFGGLLSSDKLKAFASINDSRNVSASYDDDFEGELMTIRGGDSYMDTESQEKTIRPIPRVVHDKPPEPIRGHRRSKTSFGKSVGMVPRASRPRSPTKPSLGNNKFELPARPDLAYREQSVEDYSDLFVDNDNVFDTRVNQAVKRVSPLKMPCKRIIH
jgi:hypothetical protein